MAPRTALVRPPAASLADGIVTHLERQPVDVERARRQHAAYAAALASAGWAIREIPAADDLPDSVFVEDAVVVVDELAVMTRPGAAQRRPELTAVEDAARDLGLTIARLDAPATLDGGDVLQVGETIYVGRSARTNDAGIAQLADLVAPRGRRVVPVELGAVLHLKSAVTALPDGTFVGDRSVIDMSQLGPRIDVLEPSGCHVVPLGGNAILMAESAPRTAEVFADRGLAPVVVDISEFEKLEGCVTCLCVLVGS